MLKISLWQWWLLLSQAFKILKSHIILPQMILKSHRIYAIILLKSHKFKV